MKKLLAVLIVLAFVAPAMADDTLDVSGEYRLEWYDMTSFTDTNVNFWDQRFRLQFKVKPADGVMAVLRGDFAEGQWGDDGMPQGESDRPAAGTNEVIMIDKAYVNVKKGIVGITAGLQGYSLGDSFGYNNQGTGIDIKIAPKPVTVRLGYTMVSEGDPAVNQETDESANDTNDIEQYYIDLGFKTKGFSVNAYHAFQHDGRGDDEPEFYGAMVKAKAGPMNIKAFVEMFGGENTAGVDYDGIQFYADLGIKMGSAAKIGGEFVYSTGEDEADKNKTTRMPNAYAAYRTYIDRGPAKGTVEMNPFGSASDMLNLPGDAGSMGGRFYGEFKVIPELMLGLTLGGFFAEEDVDQMAHVLTYSGYLLWSMAPKTSLGAGYMAWDPDEDSDYAGSDYETYEALYAIMKVKF